jgi:hypothetical protein
MYGGLLCSSCLVVYGVSALLFAHPISRLTGSGESMDETRAVSVSVAGDPVSDARSVAEGLGLFGMIPQQTVRLEDDGALAFSLIRPGRNYVIRYRSAEGSADVSLTRGRPGTLLLGLHDARLGRGSVWMTFWWAMSGLTVLVMVYAGVSGVTLWSGAKRDRAIGWTLLGSGAMAFGALVFYLAA